MNKVKNIILLWAATIFTACSVNKDDTASPIPASPSEANKPVAFGAYTARDTRSTATPDDISDISALAQVGGFGVFAYEQGTLSYSTYSTSVSVPNFFNNQQVWSSTQTTDGHKGIDTPHDPVTHTWEYAPVKYFSNNENARHSFFAYAPYSRSILATFETGKAPQIRYTESDDIDLLWAKPTIDMQKPNAGSKILFTFQRALSKSQFFIAPFIDNVHGEDEHNQGTPPTETISKWPLAKGTTVRIRSLKFIGTVPSHALLNLGNGEWTMIQSFRENEVSGVKDMEFTGEGEDDIDRIWEGIAYKSSTWTKQIPAQDLKIEILYDVISGDAEHVSHVTHRAISQNPFSLEAGRAYRFFLDLGMTIVKFSLIAVDWDKPDGEEYEKNILIEDITSSVVPWVKYDGDVSVE